MPHPKVPEVLAIIIALVLCAVCASYIINPGEVYNHPEVYLP